MQWTKQMKYGIALTTKSLLIGNPQHSKIQGRNTALNIFLQSYPWTPFQVCILPATEEQELSAAMASWIPLLRGLLAEVAWTALLIHHISPLLSFIVPCSIQSSQFCELICKILSWFYFPADYLSINAMPIHNNCLKHDAAKLFNSTLAEPHRLLWKT